MYVFPSISDRDSYNAAHGDKCAVGNKKYVYKNDRGWLELVSTLSFENTSLVDSCGCTNCGC